MVIINVLTFKRANPTQIINNLQLVTKIYLRKNIYVYTKRRKFGMPPNFGQGKDLNQINNVFLTRDRGFYKDYFKNLIIKI